VVVYNPPLQAQRLLTDRSWWVENLACNGHASGHPVKVVGKRAGVAVGKCKGRGTDRARSDMRREERDGVESRAGRLIQDAAVRSLDNQGCGDRKPQRRPVEVVGKPRGKDRCSLLREIDAPSRLRARGRCPPQILIVVGDREVREDAEGAGWKLAEHLARDVLGLRSAIDRVGERAVIEIGEGECAVADRPACDQRRVE